MSKSIYLINPRSDFPTYYGGEAYAAWGEPATINCAELALPTIAALMPANFDVRMCDEGHDTVDYDAPVDYVGITGKISQGGRMMAIADRFRARGKTVMMGGPYASLSPEVLRPHCDILIRGEIETIAGDLFSDLQSGRWKDEYEGDRPDLTRCPVPRWERYPNAHAISGTVQTSRGCPFECEFFDVIQYLGRRQRHKSVAQVLAELDEVSRFGYRTVFLADDNLTVHRSFAKEMLAAIRDWNVRRHPDRLSFTTQVSIDAARDEELLSLCAEAGITNVFVGIETPNQDSLKEARKRQNLNIDLTEQVGRFLAHGISVTGGMIIGFDSDGPDIFDRQYEFAMATPIPIFTMGALVAPAATPLHARMERDGRLTAQGSEIAATPWDTNIIPRQMTREQLVTGFRRLCNTLYSPRAFGQRVFHYIDSLDRRRAAPGLDVRLASGNRPVMYRVLEMLGKFPTLGPAEAELWTKVQRKLATNPSAAPSVTAMLVQYMQVRHMFAKARFWDLQPVPNHEAAPPVASH